MAPGDTEIRLLAYAYSWVREACVLDLPAGCHEIGQLGLALSGLNSLAFCLVFPGASAAYFLDVLAKGLLGSGLAGGNEVAARLLRAAEVEPTSEEALSLIESSYIILEDHKP